MIATSLTAVMAVVIAAPESALVQETPYASVAPAASNQPRVLRDQDAALFRQGLAAARARDVVGARNAASQISDPAARKLVEWALLDTSAESLSWGDLSDAQSRFAAAPRRSLVAGYVRR